VGYHVIYVTGPPATGKSTLTRLLKEALEPAELFTYSAELAAHVAQRSQLNVSQDSLRTLSGKVVTTEDVRIVDEKLVRLASARRHTSNIVIDSHAVTKEQYGFRVTPFSLQLLAAVMPTIICMLYVRPSVILERISTNPQGRPIVTEFEADFHSHLQSSVAISYGINLGTPIYFLDAERPTEHIVADIVEKICIV